MEKNDHLSDTKKFISNIKNLSFEEAMAHLDTILKKLENGSETLESSISYYEIGDALKKHCEKKLSEAKLKIEKIIEKSDGQIDTEEFSQE